MMQSYFLAPRNPDNDNIVVGQELSVPSMNQTMSLNSISIPPMQEAIVSLDAVHDFVGA